MVPVLVVTPPTQSSSGGAQSPRGRPRGRGRSNGGPACCNAFLAIPKVVTLDFMITGIVSVFHRDALVLFDPGSTNSYVSSYISHYLDMPRGSLDILVYVSMLVGDSILVDRVYRSCVVTIEGYETRVDLLLLNMIDFEGLSRLEWKGYVGHTPSRVIYFLKAQRMIEKGCLAYLSFVRDVSIDTPIVESVLAVREFPDLFPANLPGMPLDRDINFGVDLVPGTQPVSIPLYHCQNPKIPPLGS
ncbi:uncharacterized protein [Nicotiana tomentosiformis]|uniref:uncharacterized protein n=1 Tax=Nicotiana tomentosiformis TaxID=4098 RepID=UPI00388CC394